MLLVSFLSYRSVVLFFPKSQFWPSGFSVLLGGAVLLQRLSRPNPSPINIGIILRPPLTTNTALIHELAEALIGCVNCLSCRNEGLCRDKKILYKPSLFNGFWPHQVQIATGVRWTVHAPIMTGRIHHTPRWTRPPCINGISWLTLPDEWSFWPPSIT